MARPYRNPRNLFPKKDPIPPIDPVIQKLINYLYLGSNSNQNIIEKYQNMYKYFKQKKQTYTHTSKLLALVHYKNRDNSECYFARLPKEIILMVKRYIFNKDRSIYSLMRVMSDFGEPGYRRELMPSGLSGITRIFQCFPNKEMMQREINHYLTRYSHKKYVETTILHALHYWVKNC